jgi:cytochrome oxidase assembly protein ShyY1
MKKWLSWIALVLVFSIACGFLANWQFSRRESKLASIQLVEKNYRLPSVDYRELFTSDQVRLPELSWRTVSLKGHYLPEQALLVRNRPNDGQPGFEELVPFMTDLGQIFYITRGWIPTGSKQDFPDQVSLPSSEAILLTARIMPQEPILNRTAPDGQIATINVSLANKLTGLHSSISNSYLRLVAETPSVGRALKPMPAPTTEEGNNLSYALQWMLFAIMAASALIWRIRKDSILASGEISKAKIKRSDLDAQFEDQTTRAK